jgi:hypothetical protein
MTSFLFSADCLILPGAARCGGGEVNHRTTGHRGPLIHASFNFEPGLPPFFKHCGDVGSKLTRWAKEQNQLEFA